MRDCNESNRPFLRSDCSFVLIFGSKGVNPDRAIVGSGNSLVLAVADSRIESAVWSGHFESQQTDGPFALDAAEQPQGPGQRGGRTIRRPNPKPRYERTA